MYRKLVWLQVVVLLAISMTLPSFAEGDSNLIGDEQNGYMIPTGSYEAISFTSEEVPGLIVEYQGIIEAKIEKYKTRLAAMTEHFDFETAGEQGQELEYHKWQRDVYYPWFISLLESYKTTGVYVASASGQAVHDEFYNMRFTQEVSIYGGYDQGIVDTYIQLEALGELTHFQKARDGGFDGEGGFGGAVIGGVAALIGLGVIGKIRGGGKKKKKVKTPKKKGKVNEDPPNVEEDASDDSEEDQDETSKLTLSKTMLPLVSGSGQTVELVARVLGNGEDQSWIFDYEKLPEFMVVMSAEGNKAKFNIAEKRPLLGQGEHIKEYIMEIRAKRGEISHSRIFKIVVGKEGMFLRTETPLKIYADMETETDLRVAAVWCVENQFQTDYTLLDNIEFKFVADDYPSIQMFKAAKVDFNVQPHFVDENFGVEGEFHSISYRLKTEHALPSLKEGGDSTVHTGQLLISSRAHGREDSIEISVELHPPAEPSRSQRIEEEYKNCIYIIDHYVKSPRHQEIFKNELNQWKELWGPEQIFKFRHEVWAIAQKLILAEGAEGYDKMADYYDRIAFTKKWTMWAGDIAFEVVLNAYTGLGPQGVLIQTSASLFKDTVISAIEYIRDCWVDEEKFSAEAWFDMEIEKFIMSAPGHMITAGTLKGAISGGRAIVYMIVYTALMAFVNSINWSKWGANWENGEMDLSDLALDLKHAFEVAFEEMGKALLKMGLIMIFSAAAMKSALRNGEYVHPDHVQANAQQKAITDAPQTKKVNLPEKPMDSDSVQNACMGIFKENDLEIVTGKPAYSEAELPDIITRMEANSKNGVARPEDVLAILSDTDVNASRTMKGAPERLQRIYDRGRRAIYKEHDQHLIAEISKIKNDAWCDRAPDGRLMPPEFRIHETSGSSLSQDRDFGIQYMKQGEWFEVTDSYWKKLSDDWWFKRTGKTAEQNNQMGMTRHGEEASLDYATQKFINGRLKKVTPNMNKVYKGETILIDSISLSSMWINKTKNANCKAEAIAQIKKLLTSHDKIVNSYKKQGVEVPKTTTRMDALMGFMRMAADDMRATPEYIGKLEGILSKYTDCASIEEAGRALSLHMGNFKCQNRM